MWTDEIVEEIHRIREAYSQSLNDDLDAIFTDLRKKEAASGRKIVNLSRKPGSNSRWSGQEQELSESGQNVSYHPV
jgi:hypothetical protein